jgi:hypothetical protein
MKPVFHRVRKTLAKRGVRDVESTAVLDGAFEVRKRYVFGLAEKGEIHGWLLSRCVRQSAE